MTRKNGGGGEQLVVHCMIIRYERIVIMEGDEGMRVNRAH